jgi:Regulator of chromosome condensation (RCC1) repeat
VNLSNVTAIAAGFRHSLALRNDGTVAVWGDNTFGQLQAPPDLSGVAAIAAGAYHSLALKADGSVVAWGFNNTGQTNVPGGLRNVVAVAAGIFHSLALQADGRVIAWGDNTRGQTNVPAGLSNVVAIASGAFHCLALKADGMVTAWGYDNLGQTNVPANLNHVAAIACGAYYNLALKSDDTVVAWGDNGSGQTNLPPGLTNIAQLAGGMAFGLAMGNQAPQANPQTVSGYVNHDLLVALSGNSPDGHSLTYRVTTLPAVATLYQFSGGARGSLISAPDTAVEDNNGRIVFAPGTNEVGAPYSTFAFVANDGVNDSTAARVTVNISLPPMPQLVNSFWSAGSGSDAFALFFSGASNATYSVWASTNLAAWSRLGTASEVTPGQYGFTDTLATNWPVGFYRISAP